MNRSEWTGIILGTGVLALGAYAGLIVLGAFAEQSADSADDCRLHNRSKLGFQVTYGHGLQKHMHSRSIGQLPAGPIHIRTPEGQLLRAVCPSGKSLSIVAKGRSIAIAESR